MHETMCFEAPFPTEHVYSWCDQVSAGTYVVDPTLIHQVGAAEDAIEPFTLAFLHNLVPAAVAFVVAFLTLEGRELVRGRAMPYTLRLSFTDLDHTATFPQAAQLLMLFVECKFSLAGFPKRGVWW